MKGVPFSRKMVFKRVLGVDPVKKKNCFYWLTNIRPRMEENSMTMVCMIHGQISS